MLAPSLLARTLRVEIELKWVRSGFWRRACQTRRIKRMTLMKALCDKGQNACLICQNQGNAMTDARHKRGPDQLTGITFLPKPAALFSA